MTAARCESSPVSDSRQPDRPRRMLFNTQFFWPYAPVDILLAKAMQLRGHTVAVLACGGLPRYCEQVTQHQRRPNCSVCLSRLRSVCDRFGLPMLNMRSYWSEADLHEADRLVENRSVSELLAYADAGVSVGELGRLSLFQYFHGFPFHIEGDHETIFRSGVHSAHLLSQAASRVLLSFRPDLVLTVNGKFLQWAPLVQLAQQAGIAYVTWEDLNLVPKSGTIFSANAIAHEQRVDSVWEQEKHKPITTQQREQLYAHFRMWKDGRINPFAFYGPDAQKDPAAIRAMLRIAAGKPIIALFPNVSWDSTSIGFDGPFENMYAWLFHVVRLAGNLPDLEFVIRAHPHEKRLPEQFRSTTPVCAEIRKRFDPLPANVKLIESDSPIYSYTLASMSRVVMVYTSTLGIELALQGKRPWVAARAYYAGKGFTLDIQSPDHLSDLISQGEFPSDLTEDEKSMAERFAYLVRFRRVFSFPFMDGATGKIELHDPIELAPGRHSTMDDLCRRLVCGDPLMDIGSPIAAPEHPGGDRQEASEVSADRDLENIRTLADRQRYGRYRVDFRGFKIDCRDLMAFYIAAKDIFLRKIYHFHATGESPRIIDGGGHIGLFTLYAKQAYPNARITVFEPDPESLDLLKRNLERNAIRGVTVVEAGLYRDSGDLPFASGLSDGSSMFLGDPCGRVKVEKLSDYLDAEVDFLKLNIEGAEWDVLAEAEGKLGNVKEIVIEYHGFPETGQKLHDILALLNRCGFRYMIHDFDAETNPATKPPFGIDCATRFFLLIYAKRLRPTAGRQVNSSPRLAPISRKFGYDRGTPLDRYYIERFLEKNTDAIHGHVLEIGDPSYTRRFARQLVKSDVLNAVAAPGVTLVGDLSSGKNIPVSVFDCIILTQTLNCIFDSRSALKNAVAALKPGGSLLLTVPGISQISRYDMDRWGDYWRFTDRSLAELIQELGGMFRWAVGSYGNVAVAKAFLDGLTVEELDPDTLDHVDADYQVLLSARIDKLPPEECRRSNPDRLPRSVPVGRTPEVLLYHRIAEDLIDSQLLAVSPRNFEAQLQALNTHFQVLPLSELLERSRQGEPLRAAAAITFDDGYADNLLQALPLLEKYRTHATVFVSSGFVDSTIGFWWDALERILVSGNPLPPQLRICSGQSQYSWGLASSADRKKAYRDLHEILYSQPIEQIRPFIESLLGWSSLPTAAASHHRTLTSRELRQLAASAWIEIGSHTVSHARLSILDEPGQLREIHESKRQLEDVIGQPVRLFSYPFGSGHDYTAATIRQVIQAGYTAGIANHGSGGKSELDLFAVPRAVVRNWSGPRFLQWLRSDEPTRQRTDRAAVAMHQEAIWGQRVPGVPVSGSSPFQSAPVSPSGQG